jgi:hypothetical protein
MPHLLQNCLKYRFHQNQKPFIPKSAISYQTSIQIPISKNQKIIYTFFSRNNLQFHKSTTYPYTHTPSKILTFNPSDTFFLKKILLRVMLKIQIKASMPEKSYHTKSNHLEINLNS